MWLVSIERSFQGLLGAIKTVRIVKELIEIWLNEVCDRNNPIGIKWWTPVLWSNPFSRVLVTPSGIFHPERELELVCLCTYYASQRWYPDFVEEHMVSYRELFCMGIAQWQSVHRILFKSGFPLSISSVPEWCPLPASVKSRCKGNMLWQSCSQCINKCTNVLSQRAMRNKVDGWCYDNISERCWVEYDPWESSRPRGWWW